MNRFFAVGLLALGLGNTMQCMPPQEQTFLVSPPPLSPSPAQPPLHPPDNLPPVQPEWKSYPVSFVWALPSFYKTFHTDFPLVQDWGDPGSFQFYNTLHTFHFGDFNQDGQVDALAEGNVGIVDIVPQTTPAVFQPITRHTYEWGQYISVQAVADWNGDRIPDLLASRQWDDGTTYRTRLGIALGKGDGTFLNTWKDIDSQLDRYAYGGTSRFSESSSRWVSPAVLPTDINRDGKLDLLIAFEGIGLHGENNNEQSFVAVLLGKGDGTFEEVPTIIHTHGDVGSWQVVDIDADGHQDIVLSHLGADNLPVEGQMINGVSIFYGQANGSFVQDRILGEDQGRFGLITTTDLNHDNKPDLLFVSDCFYAMQNQGARRFTARVPWCLPNTLPTTQDRWQIRSLEVADVDGDTNQDVIVLVQGRKYNIHYNPNVDPPGNPTYLIVYAGDGKGGFFEPQTFASGHGGIALHVTDLNRDDKPDILIGHSAELWTPGNYYTAGVSVHLNQTMRR